MRPSVSFKTGTKERLLPDEVDSVPKFTEYARQELGLSYPVGQGRREAWMKFCKEEMSTQSWSFEDLVNAVRFIKIEGKSCRTLQGIFWYVGEARASLSNSKLEDEILDLQVKVAEALAQEQDEGWRRRLSLARGKALVLVYTEWRDTRFSPA